MVRRGILVALSTAVMVALLAAAQPAAADQGSPDVEFPQGQACNFKLDVYIDGAGPDTKTFFDRNGSPVRTISAGRGPGLTFVNADSGSEYTTAPNGSVARAVFNADGSQTNYLTGHFVVILFPTDIPAGPSTTLYIGRVVYTVDNQGIFTLRESSGRSIDICEALSS